VGLLVVGWGLGSAAARAIMEKVVKMAKDFILNVMMVWELIWFGRRYSSDGVRFEDAVEGADVDLLVWLPIVGFVRDVMIF
jgi:hypothetical protein